MHQSVKIGRTLYTEEKIANLRKNIAQFDWAKEKAEKIIANADFYLNYGVERLLTFFTPQEIPRSGWALNHHMGCPHCGEEMLRYSMGGWKIDYVRHPWKVTCPNCGRLYPSNDFGAFFESGLDEHGMFSYDRADRSLLVNELYPEMGPDFAVDDGHGWVSDPSDPEWSRFGFIPFYVACAAYHASPKDTKPEERFGLYAIKVLSLAYMITQDRKYGYAGAALYYRFALMYPTLDISVYKWDDGYRHCHGHTGLGRFAGSIWDTIIMNMAVEWYDMLFPCIDDAFAAYLQESTARYIGQAPQNGVQIRAAIEENIHMQMYPDVRTYIMNCNAGPQHELLLKTAKILDRDDLFDEYADYLFKYIDHVRAGQNRVDLETLFLSEIDRDGFAGEVSAGYNSMWFSAFSGVAELLRGHKYDLLNHVKFRKFGNMMSNYVTADHYTMNIADSAECGNRDVVLLRNEQVWFFLETGSVQEAQLLVQESGDGPICTDWFKDCAEVDRLIRAAAEKAGPFQSESRCFSGYGLSMIESHPEEKDPESAGLFFGHNFGHGHRDTMNLYLYGFGIDLMPDHGYPNYPDNNPERFRWTSNYICHNTAALRQREAFSEEMLEKPREFPNLENHSLGGKIHHYHTDGLVSVMDVDASHTFNHDLVDFQEDLYRRTLITIDLDGKSRYLLDLFAVGAAESHLSYHALGTETNICGAEFVPQDGGTYAGADIPYADYRYSHLWADGFNYLTNVRRGKISEAFTVDWTCVDNWKVWDRARNVHLKLHMLSGADEAALCTGKPPQTKPGNPRELTYLIAKHSGPTDYVSVLEPYEDAAFIASCDAKQDGDTVTLTVTHTNGSVDTVCVTRDGTALRVAVESTTGYRMAYGDTVLTGMVDAFTKELTSENCVTVRLDSDVSAEALVGKFIDIDTDVEPNAFYEIKGAELLANGLWKLDVGDCSFITGYIDRDHKELGMTYSIGEGASVRITM